MIIKEADDKVCDISTLKSLASRPDATPETRKRIEQEIRNIQAGARGEQEAAYEMKVHYGESRNWAVIHDLRIEYNGLAAQIDHLLLNRWLDIWVCESKHFSEGVGINEHGEFAAFFNGKPYGVPSPIEQNAKHILILKRLFDSGIIELPKRFGISIKPELKSLVLVSKKARIGRPKGKVEGIECVIKNDQFFTTVNKAVDENGILSMGKLIGQDTLEDLARMIVTLHRPASFEWAAKFGLPVTIAASTPQVGCRSKLPNLRSSRQWRAASQSRSSSAIHVGSRFPTTWQNSAGSTRRALTAMSSAWTARRSFRLASSELESE